jgi:uncharacterized protein
MTRGADMKSRFLLCDNIIIKPGQETKIDKNFINKLYNIQCLSFQIQKKSLDARNKKKIVYRYQVIVEVTGQDYTRMIHRDNINEHHPKMYTFNKKRLNDKTVLIVGAGPAGLFAALRLIESGARVILLERGRPVEDRSTDIAVLKKEGRLNLESNVLFGEGGAGTWSDGKLTTRIHRPEVAWFFEKLLENGVNPELLYEAKPHIGTDGLVAIIKNMRKRIVAAGSDIKFSERVDDLLLGKNRIEGVRTASGSEYYAEKVILAIGHSARDTYEMLSRKNIPLEQKGFAVGARIEHEAAFLNNAQYGNCASMLPAADYRLVYNNTQTKRAVYSFCMCPGGEIINSSSENGHLCTNGMSYSQRDAEYSNAALVVTVHPEDIPGNALESIAFQRGVEAAACAAGGGNFTAPFQTAVSFMKDCTDSEVLHTSYRPAVVPARLQQCYPDWIIQELKMALQCFDRKIPGFIAHGSLVGVETRSSSPVRIVRGADMQALTIKGLYPVGEGAGYAGGIVSSAVDGIRAAETIIEQYGRL